MKRYAGFFIALSLLCAAGCGGSPESKITSLQRKEAASVASEAEFAVQLRDLPRAESLLAKAAALCPDHGEYWADLGSVRARQKNREGAKAAYLKALDAYEDAYARDKTDIEALLQQVYVLALLGREKDARALLAKAEKLHADDRNLRAFVEGKHLDALMAEPTFKQIAL